MPSPDTPMMCEVCGAVIAHAKDRTAHALDLSHPLKREDVLVVCRGKHTEAVIRRCLETKKKIWE